MAKKSKKTASKQLVTIEQLRKQALIDANRDELREELGGGTFLKAQKGMFSVGEEELPEELPVIILDYSHEQALYPDEYDPKAPPQQPTCFAVAYKHDDLAPHVDAEHPEAEVCENCDLNRWEGKTPPDCSQRRRLAILDVSDESGDILIMNLSPGAIKAWRSYPALIKKKTGMLVHNVLTTISWDHKKLDSYKNPTLQFDFDDVISDPELFSRAIALREKANEQLLAPIRVIQRDDDASYRGKKSRPPLKRGKKKAGKKKVGKKKAAIKKRNRRY